LDAALTVATLALFVADVYFLASQGAAALSEFGLALAGTAVAIAVCKAGFQPLGRCLSTSDSLKAPRNLRKFSDQSWQLVIHVAMTWYEWKLLAQNEWQWWADTKTLWSTLVGPTEAREPCPPELRWLYVAQLGVWFVTAFSHKFVEAKHKDYFVMYGHHVATLGLVTLSYFNAWTPVGLLVLFIHDSSDIVTDLLKMVNYLGLDSSSGLFLAEGFFVANLVSWGVLRLWFFPAKVIRSTFVDYPFALPLVHPGTMCRTLLVVLLLMHIWWYFLFFRILYRLLVGQDGHKAGAAEYEGSSDSEADVQEKKSH
jgi:ceramide synthetase